MAGIPLNKFVTSLKIVQPPSDFVLNYPGPGDDRFLVYTAPPGTSGVVLYAQVANTSPDTVYKISCWHFRPNLLPTSWTELLVNVDVPTNDALSLFGGKLVLETSDAIYISGTAPMTGQNLVQSNLKLTMSILESANQ
jgi:hypothetical protein